MGFENLNFSIRKKKIKKFDTIYVQDFGDDYHDDRNNRDDMDIKVRAIKSMYNNFSQYIQAKEVYENYMEMLYDKYGGEKIFNTLSIDGGITDYVPPMPKLKNNAVSTNDFVKYGITNSGFASKMSAYTVKEIMKGVNNTIQEMLKYEEEMYGYDEDQYLEDDDFLKPEYRWDNMEDSEINAIAKVTKHTNTTSKDNDRSRVYTPTELTDRFYSAQNGYDPNDPFNDGRRYPTLAEALSDDFDPDKYDIDRKMKEDGEANKLYNLDGRMVTKEAIKDHELYDALDSLGWNGSKIRYNKSGGKEVVEDMIYETMTKSEKRRYKREKRAEKREQQKRISQETDRLIKATLNMATDIEYEDFEDYESSVLDFSVFDQFGKNN